MIDGPTVVAALEAAGFTHLVWIPDSHLGTWDAALAGSKLPVIRPCREGEAIGIAAGLMLGGAKPLVAMRPRGIMWRTEPSRVCRTSAIVRSMR